MTRLAGSESRASLAGNGALLAGVLICMVTGGYPYYVIYSPWLFVPYLLVLLVPRWSKALLGWEPAPIARAAGARGGGTRRGGGLRALSLQDVCVDEADDRSRRDRVSNTPPLHVFNHQDTIGSWLFPPAAQFEGWYYFGVINVMLVSSPLARRPRNR